MPVISYLPADGASTVAVELEESESVLDALLRSGFNIPYGCRAGACQSCLLQTDDGSVPATSQSGLKAAQKLAGYFLSCSCFPRQDLNVRHTEAGLSKTTATVVEKVWLTGQVIRLRLKAELQYRPGQYATLWRNDRTGRCYSLASVPGLDDYLEFHIKHLPDGSVSHWISETLEPGSQFQIQGPLGECLYACQDKNQPLLLCAVGTGLAPLYGIVRDALHQGHQGPITLLLAARQHRQFYLVDELRQLARRHDNLTIQFTAQQKPEEAAPLPAEHVQGDIYEMIKAEFSTLANYKVYLCGAPSFVRKMKKICFLQGASMADIHSDAFSPFSQA